MRIRSATEIDQMRKYSSDLSQVSREASSDARKYLDSAQHILSRTPLTTHDMREALKYAKQAVYSLREAWKNSGRSERMTKKALRAEKTAQKALLKQEKLQLSQMKKAEPAALKETVIEPEVIDAEEVSGEEVIDLVPVEDDEK